MNDVVLITVDCWRHDAPSRMPNLQSFAADDGVRADAIAPAEATPWVSTSLLHSQFHTDALEWGGDGFELDTDAPSLPETLSELGYETAAFVADNPNLAHYADHFDTYRDGRTSGLTRTSDLSSSFATTARTWWRRLAQTLLLRKSVSAAEIAEQAREWYAETDGPRFLWMHLMEPHSPYHPGLARGLRTGLLDSYYSSVEYFLRSHEKAALSERTVDTLPDLHWQCVERLDDQFPSLVEFLDDDAMVVVTGDHGEALHHDHVSHVDLYDETVRVPLFVVNGPDEALDGRTVRQYDVGPAILDALGETPPADWEGTPFSETPDEPVPLLTTHPGVGEEGALYVGLRTDDRKLLKTYDVAEGKYVESRLFDLEADPGEQENVYGERDATDLERELDSFVASRDVLDALVSVEYNINPSADPGGDGVSDTVERRLVELGYA
ncbi:sulfatase-like hydrolase/transferase [Halobacterium zhouii]|uniref:sulfatase-like hydrolase/transferase n=1 Tax=Halobacterium zhouii TaxID=2902624 RepID=UPI001E64E54F|nr:sulfatase-like hydrolase/transferase [Halobacterium zhouii]